MRSVVVTDDGSHTISADGVTFHSMRGAVTESKHVFIRHGLEYLSQDRQSITILEVGFGTGLNALLTYLFLQRNPGVKVSYLGVEKFPIEPALVHQLNYLEILDVRHVRHVFDAMHDPVVLEFEEADFSFRRLVADINNFQNAGDSYDLVYFDAFGPGDQPGMWDIRLLELIAGCMTPNGVLVTYCAQGQFKRNLASLGFTVESLPGPPGKREIVRAVRNSTNPQPANRTNWL